MDELASPWLLVAELLPLLKQRSLGKKRAFAQREYPLGLESLRRYVRPGRASRPGVGSPSTSIAHTAAYGTP